MNRRMKLITGFLFLSVVGCGAPPPGHVGPWLWVAPNAGQATIYQWSMMPDSMQTKYVYQIADGAQKQGLRCKSGVTVGAVYYELHSRMNHGKYTGDENLVRESWQVMNDLGCE